MDLFNFCYLVYCVCVFPIWIAAISLTNSTSESNSSVMNKNISRNYGVIDGKSNMVLKTGNESTESNLFPNLESPSTTTVNNYIDLTNDVILNKAISTEATVTHNPIHQRKNVSSNSDDRTKNNTELLSNTTTPENTIGNLSQTVANMAARDIEPNNIYNVSSISIIKNITSGNSSGELNDTLSSAENDIKNASQVTISSNTTIEFTEKESLVTSSSLQATVPVEKNLPTTSESKTSHSKNIHSTVITIQTTTYNENKHSSSIPEQTTLHFEKDLSTEFAQNVKIGKKHKKHKAMHHHLNLVPIEDGPFGSLIWKDKKYLISVLVPIGIGIIGAGCIIGMAYVVRFCQKTEQQVQRMRQALSQPKEDRNDQIVLLVNSSDDDF